MSNHVLLFTDGSVNTKTKVGFGAYLIVDSSEIQSAVPKVKLKRFENTSSTKLELETLLWALNEIQDKNQKIKIYTDSQNIMGLPNRKFKLEQNNFYSGNGKQLNNHELYRVFYKITSTLNCEFIKLEGHSVSSEKNDLDKLFMLVDRASRKATREEV
ncbi:MAG: ribonuclease H [Bacteroidetes bacterium]|nr:ribonuclease H [Bacteroidota bacterium]